MLCFYLVTILSTMLLSNNLFFSINTRLSVICLTILSLPVKINVHTQIGLTSVILV